MIAVVSSKGWDIKSLEEDEVVLFLVSQESIPQFQQNIWKQVGKTREFMIYITANKPYATMVNILNREKVDLKKVFFIDLVTQLAGFNPTRAGNVLFCPPASLTHLSITIQSAVSSLPKESKKILFFDSLSTLLLYNESKTLATFAHSLLSKLRAWQVKGLVLMLDQESDKVLISQVSSFCDKVIKI